uniref:Cytochrome c oxidase subunit 2 n=1 Tax=Callionymus reticulatus TaxID=508552 RepID=A0A7G8QC19_9TELE|nr:cytochrome c oxidase subunit II [Callionymus reticulatus]
MSSPAQLGLQNTASPLMEEMMRFHDHVMMAAVLITLFVVYTIVSLFATKMTNLAATDAQEVEFVWTVLPVSVLVLLALPSLRLLYLIDEMFNPCLTIKAIGYQWYWSYEYTDLAPISYESYMTPMADLSPGQFRLLDVDNRMFLPTQTPTRLIISANDVLHSWAVPSLGAKADAVPGRLNQMELTIMYPGVHYGQCSEICGANHSFMPICVESTPIKNFEAWASYAPQN